MLSDFFRINLPYGLKKNDNNQWMAFNREYYPIGFNPPEQIITTNVSQNNDAVFTDYIGLSERLILELTEYDETAIKRDKRGNIYQFWLYSDSTNPLNQRNVNNKFWQRYFKKIEKLASLGVMRSN